MTKEKYEKNNGMPGFHKIDMENWPRKEHYKYYTELIKIQYNMTADIDVSNLLDFCHTKGYKFYPAFICMVSKVLNSIENFRMFKNRDDELCVWDHVVPNYTLFHDDDKTFSDCWSKYAQDFDELYQIITSDMDKYKDVKGIKARDGQPGNFYCISLVPWVNFTCFTSRVTNGEPQFFPVITAGKYQEKGDKIMMPVNILVAHAVCDGYHTGLFFNNLQEEIDNLK